MSRTSGAARSSHQSTLSWRALSELTFQVAIRTLRPRSMPESGESPAAEVGDREPIRLDLEALGVLLERQGELLEGLPRRVRVGRRQHERAVGVLRHADDPRDVHAV